MAKQSLKRRSTKIECTLFDRQSKLRAHHGSCKTFQEQKLIKSEREREREREAQTET
jgi:hypothetical protein